MARADDVRTPGTTRTSSSFTRAPWRCRRICRPPASSPTVVSSRAETPIRASPKATFMGLPPGRCRSVPPASTVMSTSDSPTTKAPLATPRISGSPVVARMALLQRGDSGEEGARALLLEQGRRLHVLLGEGREVEEWRELRHVTQEAQGSLRRGTHEGLPAHVVDLEGPLADATAPCPPRRDD